MKRILPGLILLISTVCMSQDLIVTSVTGSQAYGVNDIFSASITVKNNGIVGINTDIIVKVYLSADGVFDNTDLYVGYGYAYTLKAGASLALAFVDNRQITVPIGTYNAIAVADPGHLIQETDETNNTLVTSGYTVGASNFDFSFSSFTVASTLYIHDTFTPQFQINNPGTYSAGNRLFTSYFLSKDQTFDASDVACGKLSNWLNAALNNTTATAWDVLEIPVVTPGQYYLIVKVDPDNNYIETNENNNAAVSGQVTINYGNIDIQASGASAINTSSPGSFSGTGSVGLYNNGTTGAANVNVQAYLSPDLTFDYSDLSLQTIVNVASSVAAKSSASVQFNYFAYSTINPGTYYIIVVADPNNALGDISPSNNIAVSYNPIYIAPPNPPAISVTGAKFADSYDDTDKSFAINTTFFNSGTNFFNDVVSYQITIKDASNVTKYTTTLYQYLSIGPGQSTTLNNLTFTLSNPLPYGNYSVNLSCADQTKCNADSYNFNLKVDQPFHSLSGIIQGEDGTPITNGNLFLYQKDGTGNVKFIQKIMPTTSANFSFSLDNHQHTLYFIPDAIDYPQYVPTIFGKTVTLTANNFVKISKDTTVTFEILKLTSLPLGSETIQGNVSTGAVASGRVMANVNIVKSLATAAPIPILLLNSDGDAVAITRTDASGNYAFNNLPAGNYQVLVVFELDQPNLMTAPVSVDATTSGKVLNFNFSSGALTISMKSLQLITFSEIAPITYVHDPITLAASASSTLPVTYTSSNQSVATIQNNQINIVGVGTSNIKVSQSGDNVYEAANDVVHVLNVTKGVLNVIAQNQTKTYGDANPVPSYTFDGFKAGENITNSGVTFPSITTSASQNSDAGSYPIGFTGGDGGSHYTLNTVNGSLIIKKAGQNIQFESNLPYNINNDTPPITFQAESSSGLPVTFQIIEGAEIVTQNGSTFTLTGKTGIATVRVQQLGNLNYNAAIPVDRTFKVNLVLGLEPEMSPLVSMSPNPTKSDLHIKAGSIIRSITLWDMLGKKVNQIENLSATECYLSLTSYNRGIYLVNIVTENEGSVTRRILLE